MAASNTTELDANDALAKDYQRVMTIGSRVQDQQHGLYDEKLQGRVDQVLPELLELEEVESAQRVKFAVQQERDLQQHKLEKMKHVLCKRYAGKIARLEAEEKKRAELMEQLIENACSQRERIFELAAQPPTLEFKEGPTSFNETMVYVRLLSEELHNIQTNMTADYEKNRQKPQYVGVINEFQAQVAGTYSKTAKDFDDSNCEALQSLFQQVLTMIQQGGEHPTQKIANLRRVLKEKLEVDEDVETDEELEESERSFVYAIIDGLALETPEIPEPCPDKPIKVCRIREFEPPSAEVEVDWIENTHENIKEAASSNLASLILKELAQVPLDDHNLVRKAIETIVEAGTANSLGPADANKHFIEAIDSLEIIKCHRFIKFEDPIPVNNLIGVSDSMEILQKTLEPTSSSHEI